jgi:hypothetical protein
VGLTRGQDDRQGAGPVGGVEWLCRLPVRVDGVAVPAVGPVLGPPAVGCVDGDVDGDAEGDGLGDGVPVGLGVGLGVTDGLADTLGFGLGPGRCRRCRRCGTADGVQLAVASGRADRLDPTEGRSVARRLAE